MTTLAYRPGAFTSFRRAMLNAVRGVELARLDDEAAGFANPFAQWQAETAGDYHTTLLELWAYLADILTFYQERIANEAYLPTATERDSLRRLAALLNYRPGPGAAAKALLAFTIEQNKAVNIPADFRLGSRATPGKAAAVFETAAALEALAEHNEIRLSASAPTNQFAALGNQNPMYWFQQTPAELWESVTSVYPLGGASYYNTLVAALAVNQAQQARQPVALASAPTLAVNKAIWWPELQPIYPDMRTVVVQDITNRLSVGDYVLLIEGEGKTEKERILQQISTVITDKAANTTTITWKENDRTRNYKNVTLFAFRVTATLFGSNAPNWYSLPATLTNSDDLHDLAPFQTNWDDPEKPASAANRELYLDSVYDEIKAALDNPGWAVLQSNQETQIVKVTDARPINYLNNAISTISAKVTRLTLDEEIEADQFPLRRTVILAASEPLQLQNKLPLPDPLSGTELILDGLYRRLKAGMTVVVQGEVYQKDANTAPRHNAEVCVIATAPILNTDANLTTITLKEALKEKYVRAQTTLLANVVEATQGETVREEILGSGNGGAFQSFRLKKNPLTYLPAPAAANSAAVASTLRVTVNGVQWQEQPTLADAAPDAPVFTATQDDAGQTMVSFGDGQAGARPPSGKDNVRARYRKGLGASGNVEANGVSQLLDNLAGLQAVANPLPSYGVVEPESAEQLRRNAPASIRTFGRAVSAADYAALALSYPGVAQARAAWVRRDAETLQVLAQPHVQLVIAAAEHKPLSTQPGLAHNLRSFLDQRRDPNVPLRIVDFTPVYLECAAVIDVQDGFPRQATLARALAALNPGRNPDGAPGYFASERLGFGQSIHLSSVYAALQAVPGVQAARITALHKSTEPATVRDDIFLRPQEIAVLRNDPARPEEGHLTITLGAGGFNDL